jgi:RNA polymerase sigma factor (sigma-70 family)
VDPNGTAKRLAIFQDRRILGEGFASAVAKSRAYSVLSEWVVALENEQDFAELLAQLRCADEQAVCRVVALYEPYLRRIVRRRLSRTPYQAIADSSDICQSVFAAFLVRIAAGDFDLLNQDDLTKLLLGMARRKLAALMRRENAARRDRKRTHSLGNSSRLLANPAAEPSIALSSLELVAEAERRLTDEERQLFQWRRDGRAWSTIAEQLGVSEGMVRKRLSRGLKRVVTELGLEDTDEPAAEL